MEQNEMDSYEKFVMTNKYIRELSKPSRIGTKSVQCCSLTRAKLIFTSIIILIAVLIVVAVTLVCVLKLRGQSNKSASTVVPGNVYFYTTRTTTAIYDVGNGGSFGGSPCTSHTVLNDPSRNVATSGFGGTCDAGPWFNTSLGGRWIRFMGPGGTIMPMTSPGVNHCGAYVTGWFNGTLPTVVGIITNGTACFVSYASDCVLGIMISIVNCDSFYVYLLPPIILCNGRYCTV